MNFFKRILKKVIRHPWIASRLLRGLTAESKNEEFIARTWREQFHTNRPCSIEQNLLLGLNEFGNQSQSQLGQDLFAIAAMPTLRTPGFFVEFGATDGVSLSNTHLLEKQLDWRGILCEPNPVWHEDLLRNRTATISFDCIGPTSGELLEFLQTDQPELATLSAYTDTDKHAQLRHENSGSFQVTTVSLAELLDKHQAPKYIDFLSIDTEGSEYDILCSLDFETYRFRSIAVEHNHSRNRERIHELLQAHGYSRVFSTISRWDDWYIDSAVVGH